MAATNADSAAAPDPAVRARDTGRDVAAVVAAGLSQLLLAFVAGNERAPRLRTDRALGLPDHVELTVALDLADHHRLVQMVVGLVHRRVRSRTAP